MSKQSSKVGEDSGNAAILALRRNGGEAYDRTSLGKARILGENFFLASGQADLLDIKLGYNPPRFSIDYTVTAEEVQEVILKLLNNKALGPDGILNKIQKAVRE